MHAWRICLGQLQPVNAGPCCAGGFAPPVSDGADAMDLLEEAIEVEPLLSTRTCIGVCAMAGTPALVHDACWLQRPHGPLLPHVRVSCP